MTTRNPLRDLRLDRIDGDAKLTATISPCSFMYPSYGLQITVKLNDGQDSIIGNRKPMETVTEADVEALFDTVKIHPCVQCQAPAFDRATIPTNPEGLCWKCINEKIKRELDAETAAERQELESELAMLKEDGKAKGYTHLVTALIHPDHGDDYFKYFFTKGNAPQLIEGAIRKAGSQVTSSYRVEPL